MVCQGCGAREATVLVQTVINNQVKKASLCSSCAGQAGPAAVLDAFMQTVGGMARQRAHPARCGTCRTSFAHFRQKGLFGCPDCYECFLPQVQDLLPRVHAGAYHHRGKTPGRR